MLIVICLKTKYRLLKWEHFGHFLLRQIYYIFTIIDSFKTWFVVGILRFMYMFWTFKLSFDVDILAFFLLEHSCGNFFQKLAIIFLIFWSPCLQVLFLVYFVSYLILSTTTFSIMTLRIKGLHVTLRIKGLHVTLSICDTLH